MDFAFQEIAEGGIHQAVPRDRGDAAERLRHDVDPKMALSAGGSGMPDVQVALVLDAELERGELGREPFSQPLFAARTAHVGAPLEGLPEEPPVGLSEEVFACAGLVLVVSHTTWGIMKSSIATLMPKTLKFTQTLSAKFRAT